jgi:sugar/nucleoside kinase (ribokinase family)
MAAPRFDVLGIGNAIVDVIAVTEDDFLLKHSLNKGAMTLVDEARALELYKAMGASTIASGGSAANTIAGVGSFGLATAFIGKVKGDESGLAFTHDIRAQKTHFETPHATDGPATARCLVLVTPDGERTMNTYLGACQNLTPADVDEATVKNARITYLEGYLWDPPEAKKAFVKAAEIAHAAGRQVALTLSDAFCVDRYRAEFLELIRNKTVDIVFANQHELRALYETSDFDSAVAALRNEDILAAVTRSEQGSLVVTREETLAVPAYPIDKLVDTTGAGDLYAAGFLAGLSRDAELKDCARLGALAASEIIQHYGARPLANLADLAKQNGLSY